MIRLFGVRQLKGALECGIVVLAVLAGQVALAQAQTSTLTRSSSFEYDASGLLIKEIIEPDTPNNCLQTSYTYDVYGNKISSSSSACAGASAPTTTSATAARGSTSVYATQTVTLQYASYVQFTIPAGQFATSSANALNHTETRKFDPRFGAVFELTGPNGLTTKWDYDTFGRKHKELRSDGTYTLWTYAFCSAAGANCPALQNDMVAAYKFTSTDYASTGVAMAATKISYVDALGRTVRSQTTGFDGNLPAGSSAPIIVQDTEYNFLGQVKRKSQPYALVGGNPNWTTYTYDAIGRVVTETSVDPSYLSFDPSHPSGFATSTMSYSGMTVVATNSQGQTKTTIKNVQGQVASVTDHLSSVTSYSYDALGQLITTNAAGSVTTLTYNQRGQKTGMIDPAMGVWSYQYNAFGELVSQTDSLAKTTTMLYDVLGRMTKRTEPPSGAAPGLISDWYFDTRFNGAACPKGTGKLCEARSNNGYKRINTFDGQGRIKQTSTVLDSATTPAVVAVTYSATTGRVAAKTWPSINQVAGYQAAYAYSPTGYLKTVTGTGTAQAGMPAVPTARITVLAMNDQGQVTQYKYGNNVITAKTFENATGRLLGVEAHKDGTPAGSVQNMSYAYDSLSNLKNRHDHFTGVNETFSYDGLNRLLSYIEVGGSVGTYTVETKYDARGNITYKSDVGQFWYDAARPNRMTNVTLSAPAGAAPLTGNRALSYAFDDYLPTAQSANGTTLGNGNLMYTVSHNAATNKHTVRWESYTSFNMIHEIKYANIGAGTGGSSSTATTSATMTLSCGAGQTLVGSNCVQNATTSSPAVATVTVSYSCPAGYTLSGTTCTLVSTQAATATYSCAYGYTYMNGSEGWGCYHHPWEHWLYVGAATVTYSCPAGWTLSGTNCSQTTTVAATATSTTTYSCPTWGTMTGTGSASMCTITIGTTTPAGTVYSCPAGYQLSGTQCQNLTNTATSASSGATADRTLTFTYGPEHQRIKQITALSGNGTSSYQAGTTWYLNGSDSLGLTYEKNILTNGITEHRHYLSGAGITFAQFTQRTGTGVTATSTGAAAPQALRYFHHDHLGSIAVITKETGTAANNSSNIVVERLAFDPWGKRRFPNGLPDLNDAIVGVSTDRGYTEHEHLDEMGVIHMNGRVYDPLIGRFMSADPFIQAPYELQSHNRYSYVMNNPLGYRDPTGYSWWTDIRGFVVVVVAAVADAYGCMGYCSQAVQYYNMANSAYQAYQQGGWSGVVSSFARSYIQSYIGESVFGVSGGVGEGQEYSWQHYAATAIAGCVSSVASGGNCRTGAVAAVAGKFATQMSEGYDFNNRTRELMAQAAGGAASKAAGGTFANGAQTASYGYLHNKEGDKLSKAYELGKSIKNFFNGVKDGVTSYADGLAEVAVHRMALSGAFGETAMQQAQAYANTVSDAIDWATQNPKTVAQGVYVLTSNMSAEETQYIQAKIGARFAIGAGVSVGTYGVGAVLAPIAVRGNMLEAAKIGAPYSEIIKRGGIGY